MFIELFKGISVRAKDVRLVKLCRKQVPETEKDVYWVRVETGDRDWYLSEEMHSETEATRLKDRIIKDLNAPENGCGWASQPINTLSNEV